MASRFYYLLITCLLLAVSGFTTFFGAPKSNLDSYWAQSQADSGEQIDHSLWQSVLDDYLVEDDSGINLIDYEGLQGDNDGRIASYINELSSIDPLNLDKPNQKSYWINLYNALTVRLVVENYPIQTITELGESLLSRGPWNDKLLQINGRALSLNHIEHRILRPLFNDYRIHFAVNCASIGCPNLSPRAFTAENIEDHLTQLTVAYVNHPRGLRFENGQLHLSSIFHWYQDDFAEDEQGLLDAISRYTDDETSARIKNYQGNIAFDYDWKLNGL